MDDCVRGVPRTQKVRHTLGYRPQVTLDITSTSPDHNAKPDKARKRKQRQTAHPTPTIPLDRHHNRARQEKAHANDSPKQHHTITPRPAPQFEGSNCFAGDIDNRQPFQVDASTSVHEPESGGRHPSVRSRIRDKGMIQNNDKGRDELG